MQVFFSKFSKKTTGFFEAAPQERSVRAERRESLAPKAAEAVFRGCKTRRARRAASPAAGTAAACRSRPAAQTAAGCRARPERKADPASASASAIRGAAPGKRRRAGRAPHRRAGFARIASPAGKAAAPSAEQPAEESALAQGFIAHTVDAALDRDVPALRDQRL